MNPSTVFIAALILLAPKGSGQQAWLPMAQDK